MLYFDYKIVWWITNYYIMFHRLLYTVSMLQWHCPFIMHKQALLLTLQPDLIHRLILRNFPKFINRPVVPFLDQIMWQHSTPRWSQTYNISVKQSKTMYTFISMANNSTLLQTTWIIFALEGWGGERKGKTKLN